jgi:small subunit ribosomal protein S17
MAKILIGVVQSDKSDKTISIKVESHKVHPIYKKRYVSSKKFLAHDEKNEARIGDKVAIKECRPISAKKRFTLDKILEKAPVQHKEEEPVV